MAIFRNINMSFWTDTKVVDDYTPEDKYFMLWALTNSYTNIIGCYEVSVKQMSNDLGYNKDVIENLLKRFKEIHKTILYDNNTKELLVKNWNKFNWNISPKLDNPLLTAIEKIKSDEFHDILSEVYNSRETVENKIPYRYGIEKKGYPMDTTITIAIPITSTITNTISSTNTIDNNEVNEKTKEIIDRLNELTGANFKSDGKATKDLIKNLLKEYTKEDILMVIDKMCYKWAKDEKMSEYLRPSTLFRRSNFENYYGMKVQEKEKKPDWFDKEIEETKADDKDIKELEQMFSKFV